jgi:hypothetical protein
MQGYQAPSHQDGIVKAKRSAATDCLWAARMANRFRYFNSSTKVIRLVPMMYVR